MAQPQEPQNTASITTGEKSEAAAGYRPVRIATLKTAADFRRHVASLGIDLPCEDSIEVGSASPLCQPLDQRPVNGKIIANRWAVQPMEGWDGTPKGEPTEDTLRRWGRFGESGAKLIYGGEAMAVRAEGRANPRQILVVRDNLAGLERLVETARARHRELYGNCHDLVIGFQLTHSGRFSKPHDNQKKEPRVAFRHPLLDKKFGVASDAQVFTDGEIEGLIEDYVLAAQVAAEAGADFVDIKHCHGYLLHEFLGAFTRPGKYGGAFENRTRPLREIIAGIRASGNRIELGVRLSAFDFVPFRPDPARTSAGRLGPGIPEDYTGCLPYHYGFGLDPADPVTPDLTETYRLVGLCAELGVKILNVTAGSPYYNPHIQRPAAYPPSDGYQPAADPLIDVARQIQVVREIKAQFPSSLIVVGSAYSYLQEYLPHVAQYVIRHGWTDMVGIGRAVLSYPAMLADAVGKGVLTPRLICRTFSDCTTAPRHGMISGCYPLDKHFTAMPEFQQLREVKKSMGT